MTNDLSTHPEHGPQRAVWSPPVRSDLGSLSHAALDGGPPNDIDVSGIGS